MAAGTVLFPDRTDGSPSMVANGSDGGLGGCDPDPWRPGDDVVVESFLA
jgi:hypothetical protein